MLALGVWRNPGERESYTNFKIRNIKTHIPVKVNDSLESMTLIYIARFHFRVEATHPMLPACPSS